MQDMRALSQVRQGRSRRISSYSRDGGFYDSIKIRVGETARIADISGCGVIRHIWMTIGASDTMVRKHVILRMYWDGEAKPSVMAPVGEFFGQGWGKSYNYAALPLAATPYDGRGMVCYFEMPFGNGAAIDLENDSREDISLFYYVDYEQLDELSVDTGRFHALWRRQQTGFDSVGGDKATPADRLLNADDAHNYLVLEAEGRGHFVGINYFVESPSPGWPGEGDDMWRIDGEEWPVSLHGTGTEDFFNQAWCPKTVYVHPYFGTAYVDTQMAWMGRHHYYRFFIADPVRFDKSLRLSIEHGHANNLTLDIATVAYWYQLEPHKPFGPMPGCAARENMPAITHHDVIAWRDAWLREQGDDSLWGKAR